MDRIQSRMSPYDASDILEDDPDALSENRRNILVVEDEAIVGLGIAAMLETAGFGVIGPAGNVESAIALLDAYDCSLAILDIKLRDGETSVQIAERLRADNIPFFVVSGYLADSQPAIFDGAHSIAKPIGARSLVGAVQGALN